MGGLGETNLVRHYGYEVAPSLYIVHDSAGYRQKYEAQIAFSNANLHANFYNIAIYHSSRLYGF